MEQNNNPAQAWANFAASGRVEDYLHYRDAVNLADNASGSAVNGPNLSGGRANAAAKRRPGAGRKGRGGKGSPGHGAF